MGSSVAFGHLNKQNLNTTSGELRIADLVSNPDEVRALDDISQIPVSPHLDKEKPRGKNFVKSFSKAIIEELSLP